MQSVLIAGAAKLFYFKLAFFFLSALKMIVPVFANAAR